MATKTESAAYIREWMQSVGLKQTDLVKQLGWSKAKANAVWHGQQRYNEDMLDDVSRLVNASVFELLLPPETAHSLRRIQQTARQIAHESEAPARSKEDDKEPRRKRA